MATETEEIIIQIKAENTKALTAIAEQKTAIDNLKKSTKELETQNKSLEKQLDQMSKAGKENSDEYKSIADQMKANKQEIIANSEAMKARNRIIQESSKYIQDNIKYQKQATDSLDAMRRNLSEMKKEYASLSKAERDNAEVGGVLQKSIKDLNDEILGLEEAQGQFNRNVGNYEEAIKNAIGANSTFLVSIANIEDMANATGKSFSGALANGVKAVGQAFKALLANPIVLVLSGIVAIITALSKAFKQNEEATNKLKVAFSPLTAVLNVFKKAAQAVVNVIADIVSWASDAAMAVAKFAEKIPIIGKYVEESNKLVEKQIQLEKDRQKLQNDSLENQANMARTNSELEKLRGQIDDELNRTTKERLASAEEAIELARKQGEENVRLAEERLRIAKEEAEQDGALSAEEKQNIYELEAARNEAIEEASARVNEFANMRKEIIKEERDAELAAIEEKKAAWEEYQNLVSEGQEQIYNLTLELMQEGLEKEKAIRNKQYEEDIAAAQGTEEQKAEIRRLINEKYNRDIADLEQKYSKESLDSRLAAEQANLERLLEINEGNFARLEELTVQKLEMERDAAIKAAQENGEKVYLVELQYAKRIEDAKAELQEQARSESQARAEEYRQAQVERFQEQVAEMQEIVNSATTEVDQAEALYEQAQLELEIEQQKYDELVAMDQAAKDALGISEEDYSRLVQEQADLIVAAQDKVQQANMGAKAAAQQYAQDQMDSLSSIAGSISQLFGEIAGDNEQLLKFQKIAALAQIAIDTAKGIAGAIAAGAGVPFPANLAAIASGVATVVAGIVNAKNALSQSQSVTAPAFADGGLVTGPGTGTSDSIPARLSNGESVMTAAATSMFAPLLSSLNQAGGGVPIQSTSYANQVIGQEWMSESIAASLERMPSPVVSVEDINRVQTNVKVIETLRNAG